MFEWHLELFHVVGKIKNDLNRWLLRIFCVVYVHVRFQLKTITNNLLTPLRKGSNEMLTGCALVVDVGPKRQRLCAAF